MTDERSESIAREMANRELKCVLAAILLAGKARSVREALEYMAEILHKVSK